MDRSIAFRNVDSFLRQTWELADELLLVLFRWTHAAGGTDYALFSDFPSFSRFVRACPLRTNVLAFPEMRPTTFGTPQSLEEVRALVKHRIHGDGEWGSLVVEVFPPRFRFEDTDPQGVHPDTPYNFCWTSVLEEELSEPGFYGEEELVGKSMAFYDTAPQWDTGHFFTDIYIGNVKGAY
jgi:hypothetical protein